jgi:hypothetical protein
MLHGTRHTLMHTARQHEHDDQVVAHRRVENRTAHPSRARAAQTLAPARGAAHRKQSPASPSRAAMLFFPSSRPGASSFSLQIGFFFLHPFFPYVSVFFLYLFRIFRVLPVRCILIRISSYLSVFLSLGIHQAIFRRVCISCVFLRIFLYFEKGKNTPVSLLYCTVPQFRRKNTVNIRVQIHIRYIKIRCQNSGITIRIKYNKIQIEIHSKYIKAGGRPARGRRVFALPAT